MGVNLVMIRHIWYARCRNVVKPVRLAMWSAPLCGSLRRIEVIDTAPSHPHCLYGMPLRGCLSNWTY